MLRWILILLFTILLSGCTQTGETIQAQPTPAIQPGAAAVQIGSEPPADALPTKIITCKTHRSDYYSDKPDYAALMLLGRLNAFEYHSYTHGWTLSVTVPDDWIDTDTYVKSPDGKITLFKTPEIFHVPEGSWPPDMDALASEAASRNITLTERGNMLVVQTSKNYWTYYISCNSTTFLMLDIGDSGDTPNTALHETIMSGVRLEEGPFVLYDFAGVQVIQHSRSLLEIVTLDSRFTITDHPTDIYYEVMDWAENKLCINVFTREEQYYLIFDTITGEIEEIHAPEPEEILQSAGIADDSAILSHYRYFHNFGRDYRYSIHYITTADCQYIVYNDNGSIKTEQYPFMQDTAPTEESIRTSFKAMQRTLQTGDYLAVEHEEMERIGGALYFYSYRLSRDYDTFAYALSKRLTAAWADEVLQDAIAADSPRYQRGSDGRLLYRGNHPAVSHLYDIGNAVITPESDGSYRVDVPARLDRVSPILYWHTFRYVYENGAWRWDFDLTA